MNARKIAGGVLAPKGFLAAAVACGIKDTKGKLDLAILASDRPTTAAGMFTRNRVCGAPVKVNRKRIGRGRLRAVVVNAGCANVCTGKAGVADAEAMTAAVAKTLGLKTADVAVCSTGIIGRRMPMANALAGIAAAAPKLAAGDRASAAFSKAIMTTDTVPKTAAVEFRVGGKAVRVAGTIKGAGMIAPNVATMLCFLTTDAAVAIPLLRSALREAVGLTLNRLTIDGDQSTSDTVLLFANGASGAPAITGGSARAAFRGALFTVLDSLAEQLVLDGEGASKYVEIEVTGAATPRDAERAAKAIAESVLLKCAMYGSDPNWGRIACAAGYSGARFREESLSIDIGGHGVMRRGMATGASPDALHRAVCGKRITIGVDLGAGRHAARFRTCDLTHKYVDINALYHT